MPLAAILAALPSLLSLIENGWTFIQSERTRLQQTGEWTSDQEAQFQAVLQQRAASPWQQPQG